METEELSTIASAIKRIDIDSDLHSVSANLPCAT
jgi:hypothetical protein